MCKEVLSLRTESYVPFWSWKVSCVQVLGLWKTKLSTLRRKNNKKQKAETVVHNKHTLHKPAIWASTDKFLILRFQVSPSRVQMAPFITILLTKTDNYIPFLKTWILISFTQGHGSNWTLTSIQIISRSLLHWTSRCLTSFSKKGKTGCKIS